MSDADQEAIEDEIISDFSIFIENFLEASQLEDDYIINSEIINNDIFKNTFINKFLLAITTALLVISNHSKLSKAIHQ